MTDTQKTERQILQEKITFSLMRIAKKMNDVHSSPKDFGCGTPLFPAEIHTLSAVAGNPDCNTTELANLLGVTKGAISQMIKKLENKGLLQKDFAPGSSKQLMFTLTGKGETAHLGHIQFHREMDSFIEKKMARFSMEEMQQYMTINLLVEELIDELH